MMKQYRIVLTSLLAVTLAGCASFSDQVYQYSAQPGDPVLEFTSDYEHFTKFHINTDTPLESRQCKNTHEIGELLYADSIFIMAKPNTELKTSVPAGKEILLRGYTYRQGYSCGGINKAFIPEKGKTYLVRFVKNGNYCQMNISQKDNVNAEVKTRQFSEKCL